MESSEAWGGLGDRFLVHQFLPEAAISYARAEELDPSEPVWPYRLGWSLFMDDPASTLGPFERALALLPDYPPAHESYGQVLFRLGRLEEAVPYLEKASELDSGFPQPEAALGMIAIARGDYTAARDHLEEALRRDSDHTEAHVGLAQAYLALGDDEKARHHADVSRTLPQTSQRRDRLGHPILPPAGARARATHGRSLERAKKFDEAFEQYRIAVEADPHYYIARKRWAMLLNRRGKKDEALALLEEGLRLSPDSEEILADIEKVRGG